MDPTLRRRAGNAVLEAVIGQTWDDARRSADIVVGLTDDLGLDPAQQVELADRFVAVLSLTRVLVRTMTPDHLHRHLPELIDRATDRLAMADTEGSA